MPRLHIFSWNAQGGSGDEKNCQTETKKLLMLQHAIERIEDEQCLILLQEAGAPETTGYSKGDDVGYGFTCVYAEEDLMADNQRCTIAVLANFQELELVDCIYTGHTGRRVPVFGALGKLFVLTAHMNAGGDSLTETTNVIDQITDNASLSWFLAGDFNAEPFEHDCSGQMLAPDMFNTIRYSGTRSRPKICQVFAPSTPTQGAGGNRHNTYDYAFCSEKVTFILLKYENIKVVDEENGKVYSDHNMMYFQLSLP
ncbi:MAG: hypothetical protein HFH36_09135 [Lachnospiraceae bacterium]|nr:hypothetical protein [Lachnospiraceae bacterium]